MGNKILGRRSRSFYKGFNERQVDYLKEKFETIAVEGKIDKKKFIEAYRINESICGKFWGEVDFDEDSNVDEYEFICMAHYLCSLTIEELGSMFYRILAKPKNDLTKEKLYFFTETCLRYNCYMEKQEFKKSEIEKMNRMKFEKYNFDHDEFIDQKQFVKICLKDEDYKKWMFNMGFITKRQMEYQEDVYDLVDSDIADEIIRHDRENSQSVSQIKRGAEHRIGDDEFQIEEAEGEQSLVQKKPWSMQTAKIEILTQNKEPPSQTLELDYVFGYRSFDCRNNLKFDTRGRIVYHQAAIGIVLEHKKNQQSFMIQHNDDITCLDINEDTVVTGQTGAKPCLIVWDTNKKQEKLEKKMVITDELKEGISSVCFSETKTKLAAICNDENHRIVIFDYKKLEEKQTNFTSTDRVIIASGNSSPNIPFDFKFDIDQKILVLATLRELLFISFQKGVLNANRGTFGDFTVSPTLSLLPLIWEQKGEKKKFMISGMGNGSLYLWQNQVCVKCILGHKGPVSALCRRKDLLSFVSGDKTGSIIVWNEKLEKQGTISIPQADYSVSRMIVALSCFEKSLLVGTKSSSIYVMSLNQGFKNAEKVMSGHHEGKLWGLAAHSEKECIYTGGEDRRLMKWDYRNRRLQKQIRCRYAIRCVDVFIAGKQHSQTSYLLVGYKNGVIECFDPDSLKNHEEMRYAGIKNPDEEVLNLVKINRDGQKFLGCYLLPKFKIILFSRTKNKIEPVSSIEVSSKVVAIDFDYGSQYIRFNTEKFEYFIYNIRDFAKPKEERLDVLKKNHPWPIHTLPFSPETQGVFSDGVVEEDISCCQRNRKRALAFAVGDKYSKIKLFNFPSKDNKIYNRYVGHSNQVTGLQFGFDDRNLISIGGEEKSIIVWKYNYDQIKNSEFIQIKAQQLDKEEEEYKKKREKKSTEEYDAVDAKGEQRLSTQPFLAQMKPPTDFKSYKKDNSLPQQNLSISHVFGLRNKYIGDEVRNQVRFAGSEDQSNLKKANQVEVLFPTACLAVKMEIESKKQEFYHAHREDIVSFAVDPKRKIMATGQMAEKNTANPLKKIVAIYVWDIRGKKVLNKLDGFHTVAVVLLSFSPNSKLLFSCGNDEKNTFAIYDWMSGSVLYSGPTSRAKVNAICWKSNEQFMTCGMDHVKVWVGPKAQLGRFSNQPESMFSCVSSNKVYITGGVGGLYNWNGNKSSDKLSGHGKSKVHTLVFHNNYVYSGGGDGKILQWRTGPNGEIKVSQQYFDTRVAFQQMLKTVQNIPEQQFGVLSIDFRQKEELVIGTNGASIIYKNRQRVEVIHQGHYRGELWGLSTQVKYNDDNLIVTGGDDRSVRLWDIKNKKQVARLYLPNKVRGLDLSPDGSKVVIGDGEARIYLYNKFLTTKLCEYEGKPYELNKNTENKGSGSAFVEDIKFSPSGQLVAYGCHGKSKFMEILEVGKELKIKKVISQGSSALLHVDWSRDSKAISINTQAYELLFFDQNGQMISATSTADQKWASWTRKLGFQVKGIFQGVDYSDVNTVCRDPTSKCLAVGYDDQCIRLFRYPCYIEKQVCKVYPGHSSHVTRVRFTSDFMVSLGGLDRTIIVWKVERPVQQIEPQDGEESDGLDELQQDVDLPNKAIARRVKPKPIQEFYQVEEEGDEFMAVKPWLGAIKPPTVKYPGQSPKKPKVELKLEYVQGYRVKDCRQNLFYNDQQTIIFHTAAVVVYHNTLKNEQTILNAHHDDILAIDYHRASNRVITGQVGPKPLVCLFENAKLVKTFIAPVKKGVLALAFSPDGKLAACAGMDDMHEVVVIKLESGEVIKNDKGTRKLITKILWLSGSTFVTIGICHFRLWTFSNNKLNSKETAHRYNLVSLAYDQESKRLFTGSSKGTIIIWNGSTPDKKVIKLTEKEAQASTVDCLLVQPEYLLAGTKDGYLFSIDKKTLANTSIYMNYDPQPLCPSIRAISILGSQLLLGTLGSQIYQFTISTNLSKVNLSNCKNILRCHYSPNSTWTNEVWGLCTKNDYIFTCSDDATVRCWSIQQKKLLCCASTNQAFEKGTVVQLNRDTQTNDYTDAAKSRAIAVSPSGDQVVVGSKDGTVRIYSFQKETLRLKDMFRHAQQQISDIKFGYNIMVVGSHDNCIYVYDYNQGHPKRKYAPLKKHSSYITHLDISRDSCFLQSTCGAYELLFWDLNTGRQITAGGTVLRDERWASWTCNLGWPVQGIYPKCTDGTFINSVDRSKYSINMTDYRSDPLSPFLLAVGNDNGKVCVYSFPCTIKSSQFVQGSGHSSHVTNVRWSDDDNYILSVGGEDQCLMYWKVIKK